MALQKGPKQEQWGGSGRCAPHLALEREAAVEEDERDGAVLHRKLGHKRT